jgi:hypothetical protein
MAKLNKEAQEAVANAASNFLALPDCVLHARLRDVDPTREGKNSKAPYWAWEYEVVEDETFVVDNPDYDSKNPKSKKTLEVRSLNRRLWNNTSLSEAAAFSMERTFRAHGVPIDTDTDEILGDIVKLVIGRRVIEEGDRAGEVVNEIKNLKPADPEWKEKAGKERDDRKHIDDIFAPG